MNWPTLTFTIGICIGFVVGVSLALSIVSCVIRGRKRTDIERSSSHSAVTIPVQVQVVDSNSTLSEGQESPRTSEWSNTSIWLERLRRNSSVSACGIPKYFYKDIQKATSNFTTIIGNGAFGPVYKAQMDTGETVAVKVLGTNSRQGEQEFLTEVLLLGRLHHKSLVDLVGYVAERGKHMLLYIYMSNGSLDSHLYADLGKNHKPLSWDLRLSIALDVARGLEYLHHGASPPVVHRDIKSCNILLDQSMRAKVTDFGLSRPEMIKPRTSNVRGTFGYVDPEYLSTRTFTKKSDVYSFGVLLFELITGRNPQQGLMEYVKLAVMESEGKVGWEEIVDPQLNGKYDVHNLHDMASLAFKCVNEVSKSRPSMCEIVQELSQICKRQIKDHGGTSPAALKEVSIEVGQTEIQDFSSIESSKMVRRLHSR
ncbi:hypothetical protein AAZX31_08G060300 [Glycine max]|uniref:Protein kinase domain-containing protein n=2 Tax=Glycine subgen. Soja TaxID=1462606 RepID=K7L576_SOYBN|nr:calcium/calmodulin-regulated receptor-like kinase 1 isoform X2 [Glycine max]XP_028243017.1 calcium/calmodulin-regulated receptor-like kinase 1 isoform X2 [Glycine soja]XP_040873907.1 calcium/calmodulin-regulated receptor-like kinase 1 isoform X2 [Glycine max]XP_040873908.1 calcium/calmodulin-regulated receptor-like kinase 1 isoform X2 [Glycine max]XP_040873909.1 calcium/calmodulin-regulated receptor-like kinase 1 isoform X2 [Glycine max]KAG4999435.1 hypothetical protein JHK87_020507 [Glycin|eukprot:XP_003532573.1 calcium/calmodulin-regulated receptor-like kinase 1 isoform X2 [Glycine max]